MLNKSGVARLRSFPADAPIALLAFPLATYSLWRMEKEVLNQGRLAPLRLSAAIISICVLLFQSSVTRREAMQYLENFTYVYQHHYHEVFSLTPNCLDCSLVFLYDP